MKFNKKCLYIAIFLIMLLKLTPAISIIFYDYNDKNYNNFENLKIGEIAEIDGLKFERVSDNLNEISPFSTEGFNLPTFGNGTNRSMDTTLLLSDEFGYFKIWVTNKSNAKMSVTVGYPSNAYSIPGKKTYMIWNSKKWPEGDYDISFTCGSGLLGSSYARIGKSPSDVDEN